MIRCTRALYFATAIVAEDTIGRPRYPLFTIHDGLQGDPKHREDRVLDGGKMFWQPTTAPTTKPICSCMMRRFRAGLAIGPGACVNCYSLFAEDLAKGMTSKPELRSERFEDFGGNEGGHNGKSGRRSALCASCIAFWTWSATITRSQASSRSWGKFEGFLRALREFFLLKPSRGSLLTPSVRWRRSTGAIFPFVTNSETPLKGVSASSRWWESHVSRGVSP
jgi:hypothetical protein